MRETLLERKRIIEGQLAEYDANPEKFIAEWTTNHSFCPDIREKLAKELEGINGELENA